MTTWRSKIPQTVKRTHEELSKLVRTSALRVEAGAKLGAVVDTGFMRASIYTVTHNESNYAESSADAQGKNPKGVILASASAPDDDLTAVVAVGAEYGIFVELGTTRMRAQPFLLPALEEVARSIGGEVQKVIR